MGNAIIQNDPKDIAKVSAFTRTAIPDEKSRTVFTQNQQAARHMNYAVPSLAMGIVDTVGQSIGAIDEEDMANLTKAVSPGFSDYYQEHGEMTRTIGDLAFMFVPGTIGMKAIQGGSIVHKALTANKTKNRLLNSVFTSGRSLQTIQRAVRRDFSFLAREKGIVDFANSTVAKWGADIGGRKLTGSVRRIQTAAADGIKKGIAFETAVAGTMNESETLFPADYDIVDFAALSALGIGVGTIPEVLFTRAAVKKAMVSAAPEAYDARSLFSAPIDDVLFKKNDRGPGLATYGIEITGNRTRLSNTTLDPDLKNNINASTLQLEKQLKEQVGKVATDGIEGLSDRKSITDKQKSLMSNAIVQDPTIAVGMASLETVPQNIGGKIKQQEKLSDSIKAQAVTQLSKAKKLKITQYSQYLEELGKIDDLTKQADEIASYEPLILEANGEINHAFGRRPLANEVYDPKRIRVRTDQGARTWTIDKFQGNKSFGVDEQLNVIISGGTSQSDLTMTQADAVFMLMRKRLNDFKLTDNPIEITKDSSWMKLDAVEELLQRNPEAIDNIRITQGLDIRWASLEKKYDEFLTRMNRHENALVKNPGGDQTLDQIVHALNLPKMSFGFPVHPVVEMFQAGRTQSSKALGEVAQNLDEFIRQSKGIAQFPDFVETLDGPLQTTGRNLKDFDETVDPLFMFRRPTDFNNINSDAIYKTATGRRLDVLQQFVNAPKSGGILLGRLGEFFLNRNVADDAARDVKSLVEGSGTSGRFTQQAFANRFSPAIQGANAVETNVARTIEKFLDEDVFTTPRTTAFSKLRAANNQGDLVSFNLAMNSRWVGWRLTDDLIENSDGTTSFRLDDTDFNKKKWRELFDEDMPDDAMMPEINAAMQGRYQPLGMTPLAKDNFLNVVDMDAQYFNEMNGVRKMMGLPEMVRQPFHVPPRKFGNEHVAYLVKQPRVAGNEKFMLSGNTKGELDRQLQNPKVRKLLETGQYNVLRQEQVKDFMTLQDEVFTDLQDFTDILAQTGAAKGTSVQPFVETGTEILEDQIVSLQKGFNSAGRRATSIYYEPQINFARMTHAAEAGAQQVKGKDFGNTVWQSYVDTLLGNPALNRPGVISSTWRTIEDSYDNTLAVLYDKLGDSSLRKNIIASIGKKEYEKLKKELGDHLPFENAADFMEAQYKVPVPKTMRQNMAALNRVTSTLTLRFLEFGHALLNLTGVAATMPAIVKALHRKPGETEKEWATRTWSWATPVGSKGAAQLNGVKLMTQAATKGFTKEGAKIWQEAADLGLFKQQVAEIMKTLHEPHQSFTQSMITKGVDVASFVSDKSEEISRGWAHMGGYIIATEHLGMKNKTAHIFAQKFANDVIGDYRPVNRPQVFQGAVGMPLGLFQTYMWNYYQRMFNYIENKDLRSIAVQYGMQASVFGAQSVPGFDQFTEYFASAQDGEVNVIDGLRNRFGNEAADLILYGSLSNIPKLFGQDGISLYSRGDVNVRRLPVLSGDPRDIPFISFAQNTYNLINGTIDQFTEAGQFSRQQQLELIGTYSQNRPIRMLAEIAAGVSVDRRGQVISDDVRSGLSIASRLTGLRPMLETKQLEAYSRLRGVEASRGHKRLITRRGIRSAIRGNSFDSELIEESLMNYIQQGGQPQNFRAFLRDQFSAAMTNRTAAKMEEAYRGGKMNDAMMLYNSMDLRQERDGYFE